MAHIVQCRGCKERFDADILIKDEDWCMPTPKMYWHTKCWELKESAKSDPKINLDAEGWYESLKDFFIRDLNTSLDWGKTRSQWNNFLKTGKYTPKGIYFCIRYFYLIRNGDLTKSQGGIGIVPMLYDESSNYWLEQEQFHKGLSELIQKENEAKKTRKTVNIKLKEDKKRKAKFDFGDIE